MALADLRLDPRPSGRGQSAPPTTLVGGALCVLVLFAVVPGPLSGQTILNAERFQLEEVTGAHASADLALSVKRGNTRILDLSASGVVGHLFGRHWPRLIFGGSYLSDEEDSLLDQRFLQARYSYILSPETRTFHFLQVQKNETLLLRSRWLVGSGIRRTLVSGESVTFAVGTGAMMEWERLDAGGLGPEDDRRLDALRMANLAMLSFELPGGARLLNIAYLQPDLGELSDARILNDLGLFVPITDRLRTTIALEWRRDTRPPSTLSRDDVSLTAGFAIDFN